MLDTTGLVIAIAVIGGLQALRWLIARSVGRDMMHDSVSSIELNQLDTLFASSQERPVLVFLDDPWCPISAMARRQVARLAIDVVRVDVSRQHEISAELERRTGVRHESPQMLLLHRGVAAWHASHGEIQQGAIEQALASRQAG